MPACPARHNPGVTPSGWYANPARLSYCQGFRTRGRIEAPMNASKPGYRHYVLAVLLLGYLVNSLDRSILSLLIEPIRKEFGLSDTQLGVLSGLAFALFYSALAIPVATLADRWNRRNVLALSVLLWTLMTAVCGLAGSFAALLIARIGVAIGEAGCNPASHSLLAD